MLNEYYTIMENNVNQIIEKKSKFIGELYYIKKEKDALNIIKERKKKYFDAKHHVFAYICIENNNIVEKYNDDGEPNGTAGKPILEILRQNFLCNVLIVITRYFGGILLGMGGLSRVYSNCAKGCIDTSKICKMKFCNILQIELNYNEIDSIKHYCNFNCYNICDIKYVDNIFIYIAVEEVRLKQFKEDIKNKLNRNVDIKVIKKEFVKN